MARFFKETAHGSCTAFIKEMPDTGGIAVEAKLEGEFNPKTDAWLEDIRVLPEGQGQGEGTVLIHELLVASRGCRRIIGSFETSNLAAATKLYGDNGFDVVLSKRDPNIAYVVKELPA